MRFAVAEDTGSQATAQLVRVYPAFGNPALSRGIAATKYPKATLFAEELPPWMDGLID